MAAKIEDVAPTTLSIPYMDSITQPLVIHNNHKHGTTYAP
jgi:hypothetical protein